MVFKCQENSFLKEFTSKVVSCNPAEFEAAIEGVKKKINGYEVILQDTILFPEGGGQPSDQGFLNDKPVFQVLRQADKAIHYVAHQFNVGEEVHQVIDWDKRFDHMQQHSGQHLISAIIETHFKCPTLSWWLGEEDSYVELDTPSVDVKQMQQMEDICNELIRQGKCVSVQVVKDPADLKDVHSRGLPADHVGDIRIINIDGVDSNMCCGTHVSNLSQLQVIKFLHSEKSKRKNKTLLHFLVGNRVIRKLDTMLKREQQLTTLLNNSPAEHVGLVDKQLKNLKVANKNLQNVLKELAVFEANKLKSSTPLPKYYVLHKKEAEADFMNIFIKEFGSTDVLLFLSVGDEKGTGNIVIYGPEKVVSDLGNEICSILCGKGAGKGNKFQAKVTNMANRNKAETLIKEYFVK